jgi:anti-sigma B factor antagonist
VGLTDRWKVVVAHPEPLLRMSVRRTGAQVVLRLVGEADVAGEARLRLRLADLVSGHASGGVRHLVVDLSELAFCDLIALDVLLEAAATLRTRGGSLVLRSPTRRVRRLLALMVTDGQLPVEA